ncbi:unnamed protein product (macronuclear) [Paramecium tetraurelia]|uniref:HTH psq-type domain-containing protein n=1 Tax=Paramecium tetraurelia TaxID=5888 RepID=A0BLM5_PARTE|nr:uncharacterized protein GSPATT00030075001 [Paramecium tetraurelia]CAK59442.1 unnamed protein product [Paramecium tetraurelia]|eukprot:XP_001426840.1 hypothetical protein (macronuclear) [Paramecium tetraurelia strain d4-2]
MDPKEQIQQCQILNPVNSSNMDDQEICSVQGSHSNNDSDSSFSLAEQEQECKKLLIQSSNEQEMTKRRRGKHGLKYAKITNDQREGLIKQVTQTGCTIKSAAQQLGINFSTAKAIMQIFKKEGRSCKKVIRKNKKRQSQMYKRLNVVTKDQSIGEENELKKQTDEIAKEITQQPIQVMEDQNKQQLMLIQQLTNQNLLYQVQVSNLYQENVVLSSKYQTLCSQYSQLQNMMQQIIMKTQSPLVPFIV